MSKVDELRSAARNVYRPDDYFCLNVQNGVLRNAVGTRMLTLPEELILGLHRGLEDETGQASPVVLYAMGTWWGKQFLLKHAAEVRQFYGCELGDVPLAFFMLTLRRAWALFGWGKVDLSFAHKDRGFLLATVEGSLYSEVVGNLGRTSDHLVAGLLASVVSGMAGQDLTCVEVACRSKGDARCRFVVCNAARAGVLQGMVQNGQSQGAILDALESGELS